MLTNILSGCTMCTRGFGMHYFKVKIDEEVLT